MEKKEKEEEINFEMKMGSNIRLDDGLPSPHQQLHRFPVINDDDWEIDESEFTDFTKNNLIEKKPLLKKIIDKIGMGYWNLLFILWKIKHKITKK